MSVVAIQLGQCGNQIGTDFFDTLMNDAVTPPPYSSSHSSLNDGYKEDVLERFFCESSSSQSFRTTARAVMIDTEPKVIQRCSLKAATSGKWLFSPESCLYKKQGSGNNWAQGYQRYGKEFAKEALNLARKEVEKCDLFNGFLVIMSLAGGTGSGLGTYISNQLHDNFQDACIVNNVIWPYSTGEVVLQYYNAVLSLAHLYQSSDAIIAMENDHLNKICTQLLNLKDVSFDDINRVVGHKIASVFQPAVSGTCSAQKNTLANILKELCAHPSYKLLTVKNIPQMSNESMKYSTFVWSALLKHLKQMLIADAALEEGIDWSVKMPSLAVTRDCSQKTSSFNKSVSNALFVRGKDCYSAPASDFRHNHLCVDWIPQHCKLSVWNQPRAFNMYEKSATLLSNSQSLVRPLESMLKNAWSMFASRAYLHQYNRHGLTDDDFIDSFGCLEQILADYKQL